MKPKTSGRPRLNPESPTVRVTITVPLEIARYLIAQGLGNCSAGVRRIVEVARRRKAKTK